MAVLVGLLAGHVVRCLRHDHASIRRQVVRQGVALARFSMACVENPERNTERNEHLGAGARGRRAAYNCFSASGWTPSEAAFARAARGNRGRRRSLRPDGQTVIELPRRLASSAVVLSWLRSRRTALAYESSVRLERIDMIGVPESWE